MDGDYKYGPLPHLGVGGEEPEIHSEICFLLKYLIFVLFKCVCDVCVYTIQYIHVLCAAYRGQKHQILLELKLRAVLCPLMRLPGTELGFFVRASNAPNH